MREEKNHFKNISVPEDPNFVLEADEKRLDVVVEVERTRTKKIIKMWVLKQTG